MTPAVRSMKIRYFLERARQLREQGNEKGARICERAAEELEQNGG